MLFKPCPGSFATLLCPCCWSIIANLILIFRKCNNIKACLPWWGQWGPPVKKDSAPEGPLASQLTDAKSASKIWSTFKVSDAQLADPEAEAKSSSRHPVNCLPRQHPAQLSAAIPFCTVSWPSGAPLFAPITPLLHVLRTRITQLARLSALGFLLSSRVSDILAKLLLTTTTAAAPSTPHSLLDSLAALAPHSAPSNKQKQQQRTPLLSAWATLPSSSPIINHNTLFSFSTQLAKPLDCLPPPTLLPIPSSDLQIPSATNTNTSTDKFEKKDRTPSFTSPSHSLPAHPCLSATQNSSQHSTGPLIPRLPTRPAQLTIPHLLHVPTAPPAQVFSDTALTKPMLPVQSSTPSTLPSLLTSPAGC
ncbi:hypothetical protein PTTG_06029 [Puccinia triticina 1-1 BBBD Race 1]|uniref:Uncharacterized protein n=1 Tax=Puccinia triticina (isolate 1-1 / race 1 (BBBD)) TaxID=630390 RepID=A0A0C4EYX4_PUCT1|nr:hypothetical protein PTTG_06029 [Puccinia triticina 1-1 BBBD Race 1]